MDLPLLISRIDERLKALRISAAKASSLAGKPDAIRNIRRAIKSKKPHSVTMNTLEALARALQTNPAWLLGQSDDLSNLNKFEAKNWNKPALSDDSEVAPVENRNIVKLPLRGIVQAGMWQEIDTFWEDRLSNFPVTPDPGYPVEDQFLLSVRGDSMNDSKPFPIVEGAMLLCVSFAAYGRPVESKKIVVIHQTGDSGSTVEATVKRAYLFKDRLELRPESTNKKHKKIVLKGLHPDMDESKEVKIVGVVLDIIYKIQD